MMRAQWMKKGNTTSSLSNREKRQQEGRAPAALLTPRP